MSPWNVFLVTLAIRIAVLAVLHVYSLASGQGGFSIWSSDDRYYFAAAAEGAAWLRDGDWIRWQREVVIAYPRWLALIFAVTGPSLLAGQLANAVLGAATAALAAAWTYRLASDARPARVAGWIVALYPSHVYHSVQLLKDALTTLTGVAAAWAFGMWRSSGRWVHLAACLLLFGMLMELRLYAGVALELAGAAVLAFAASAPRASRRWQDLRALAAWLAGTALVSLAVGYRIWGADVLSYELHRIRLELYSRGDAAIGIRLPTVPQGHVAYGAWLGSLVGVVGAWLLSLAHVLLAPFPWQALRGPEWALGALDAAFCGGILFAAAATWLRDLRRRALGEHAVFLAGFAFATLAAIAAFSDNIGANVRLRLLPYVLLAIPAAQTLAQLAPFRRWRGESTLPAPTDPGLGIPGTGSGGTARCAKEHADESWKKGQEGPLSEQ